MSQEEAKERENRAGLYGTPFEFSSICVGTVVSALRFMQGVRFTSKADEFHVGLFG